LIKIKYAAVFFLLFGFSCATVTQSLPSSYSPSSNESYIYGSFIMRPNISYNTMSVVINNEFDEEFGLQLKLDEKHHFQAIAVPPGRYWFTQLQYVFIGGDIAGLRSLKMPEGIKNEFILAPGEAIYLGEWIGTSSLTEGGWEYVLEWPRDNSEVNLSGDLR
jgi:hypothetical protein